MFYFGLFVFDYYLWLHSKMFETEGTLFFLMLKNKYNAFMAYLVSLPFIMS